MPHDGNAAEVIVVGAGNAALTAALAAHDRGRSVVVLERAPAEQVGGNSYYTAGATRIVHDGLEDLRDLVEPDDRYDRTVVPAYTVQDYLDDLAKVTEGRSDPTMGRIVATESADVLRWLRKKHHVRYRLMYERQAYERPDGSFLFWGGLHVGNVDGGEGLIRDEIRAAEDAGISIRYEHAVVDFVSREGAVRGVIVETPSGREELHSESVVLAAGGFEANADLRERFLGPEWLLAKVRGTPFNTGELLVRALELGAAKGGDWSTCHSVQWDAWTEHNESNRELTNRLTRQSYILGIMVNREGERFVDEGADYRNYTYAKYGADVLRQPGSIAFQVFDAELRPMLRSEEYEMPGVGEVTAGSLTELADALGVDVQGFTRTVREFNDSIDRDVAFDPNVKDGRAANVSPRKSNWANPIETAPFYGYPVTCGITFTFGGLQGDSHGRVLKADGRAIPGLFACGEALGGLFSGNYPGGSGLAAGGVFGRRAGSVA